ncbi:MAG: TldD/PmbA family protein [Egibacteraceae bacterium]
MERAEVSDAHVLDDDVVREVLTAALAGGASFAEIYAETRRGRGVGLDDGRVEDLVSGLDQGAGIRLTLGKQTAYVSTNVLTRAALVEAAELAAAGLRGSERAQVADLSTRQPERTHPAAQDPFAADGVALAELVRRAEDAARSHDPSVRQVTVRYADIDQALFLANSEGHRHTEQRVRTRLVVQVVAARDGEIQTGYQGPGGAVGHELFDDHPPEKVGAEAARKAVLMLDAEPAPAGELTVVLGPGSGGVLFHEACGHGMEADFVAKDSTVYAGRRGERIGSQLVSGVDDATDPGGWGSYSFDDEGAPAQRTVLFEEGVCTDYLTDRLRAIELDLPRSGNGRRESYAHLPIPRMSNTYILPGDEDPQAILDDMGSGLYCEELGGGQVEPASGDFVFGVAVGWLVEAGELVRPVRGANLVGDGPTVLARVDAVGSDFDVRQGVCGKEGQGVPAGLGNPTLRIDRITVGGTGS